MKLSIKAQIEKHILEVRLIETNAKYERYIIKHQEAVKYNNELEKEIYKELWLETKAEITGIKAQIEYWNNILTEINK